MKSAGTRGYSPLARVMTLAVMLLAMAAGGVWAQSFNNAAAKIEWPFNDASKVSNFTATPDGAFTTVSVNTGDLTISGTATRSGDDLASGITFIKFKPAGQTKAVQWVVKPASGLTFTPTKVSMWIQRFGVDVENGVSITAKVGEGEAVTLGTFTAPRANKSKDNDQYGSLSNWINHVEIELTAEQQAALASGEELTLSATVGVTSTKEGGFSDVVIEGTLVSAPAADTKYTVTMAEGTVDAANWTISPTEAAEGKPITATYSGSRHVKSVTAVTKAAAPAVSYDKTVSINDGAVTVTAGEHWLVTGTGTATSNQITIGDGATVTLDGVNISGSSYCIKCNGSATIILKDGSTNSLTSSSTSYPALWIGDAGTTMTIQGSTGALTVQSGKNCAGIGGGYKNNNKTCGNIKIEGGFITATGGQSAAGIGSDNGTATCGNIDITGGTIVATGGSNAAGIGSGNAASCGNINITGGTISATGGDNASGIGSGYAAQNRTASCGNITIANTVTKVTATKGQNAPNSIGKGRAKGTINCGTITIGGNVYENGISDSPYTYPSN